MSKLVRHLNSLNLDSSTHISLRWRLSNKSVSFDSIVAIVNSFAGNILALLQIFSVLFALFFQAQFDSVFNLNIRQCFQHFKVQYFFLKFFFCLKYFDEALSHLLTAKPFTKVVNNNYVNLTTISYLNSRGKMLLDNHLLYQKQLIEAFGSAYRYYYRIRLF